MSACYLIMSKLRLVCSVLMVTSLLAACEDPGMRVGGPCRYEESLVEGIVAHHEGAGFVLQTADGELFVADGNLYNVPEVGDKVTLRRQLIVSGTCTPEIFSVVEPDVAE